MCHGCGTVRCHRLPAAVELKAQEGRHRQNVRPVRRLPPRLPRGSHRSGGVRRLEGLQCDACPIRCWIKEGFIGACQRYRNAAGRLSRIAPLHAFRQVAATVGGEPAEAIRRPLITGLGAGTTYPDCKPAPFISGAGSKTWMWSPW